jgi:drug/metabolite transporter, DME family
VHVLPPEFLAMISAFCFAGSDITSKRGLATVSVNAGVLIVLGTSWLTISVVALWRLPESLDLGGLGLLIVAGLLAPGLGRVAATVGVHRMGPSTSVPIQGGAYPLLALIGGVGLLDESLTATKIVGAVAIVIGVWQLSRRIPDAGVAGLEGVPVDPQQSRRGRFDLDATFPLVAGLSFAASDVLKKQGLELIPDPLFGAMVGTGAAFLAWLVMSMTLHRVRERMRFGKGYPWFVGSGLLVTIASVAAFLAFERGDVSVVSPIVSSEPLAVFVLSVVFLKDLERLTWRTVLAGIVIVIGTLFLSF